MCQHRRLATGPVATVDLCESCQSLSVNVSAFTLRLTPGAARALVATLIEAVEALEAEVPTPVAVRPALRGVA